jgi:hypothetical protein
MTAAGTVGRHDSGHQTLSILPQPGSRNWQKKGLWTVYSSLIRALKVPPTRNLLSAGQAVKPVPMTNS